MTGAISRPDLGSEIRLEPIAVIGMACRFPGAESPAAFWSLLSGNRDAVGEIPSPRRQDLVRGFRLPSDEARTHWRRGGFLEGVENFDARFFGIAPREAERIDPQQRLLLETSWEAIEDAGLAADRLSGSSTGVFIGMWTSDYERRMFESPLGVDFYMTTGGGRYSGAGRLSYLFGFQGPSVTLDTACSSSLVAVHLACQSLAEGECELAIAGGANVILDPSITIAYSRAKMLSPEGSCKFGDEGADGYVRSEGAGVVLLKPLTRALEDGDRVRAIIRGSAVNHDGKTSGSIGRPGVGGQVDALRRAYRRAGVCPAEVSYVEAHGTGTRAGDPVELEALAAVLGEGRDAAKPLLVGSVKTNLGHLESASGIASLIKTVLCLENEILPKNLHLEKRSSRIPWDELPLHLVTEKTPWPRGSEPRFAGLNSFGISGTNAHLVLEEAPEAPSLSAKGNEPDELQLLPLSARSDAALRELALRYRDWFQANPGVPLSDVARTASVGRTHHPHRIVVAACDVARMGEGLSSFAREEASPFVLTGRRSSRKPPRIAFVFPGQGSQWLGMGLRLLDREPSFREQLERCQEAFRPEVDWSLTDELRAGESASQLARIDVVQPTLFALQTALAALWRHWGIEPAAVVGHSMGEIAAAFVAGALSLEDAARVIVRRSLLLRRVSGRGAMAMVELSMAEARKAIAGYEDRLSVAVSNSVRSTVLSGDGDALGEVVGALEARDVFCRFVKVDVASHSPQMDPLTADLMRELDGIEPRAGEVPLYSTVTGEKADGRILGPAYWARNLRETVLFAKAAGDLLADGFDVFLEVSPHPILLPAVEQAPGFAEADAVALASMRRDENDHDEMRLGLARLYALGAPVEWRRLYPEKKRPVALPSYPWQRERYWLDLGAADKRQRGDSPQDEARALSAGTILETALEAGRAVGIASPELLAVRIAPSFPSAGPIQVRTTVGPRPSASREFEVCSRAGEGGTRTTVSSGRVRSSAEVEPRRVDIDEVRRRCAPSIAGADFDRLWRGAGELLARLEPGEDAASALDCGLTRLSLLLGSSDGGELALSGLDRLVLRSEEPAVWLHALLDPSRSTGARIRGDALLLTEGGAPVVELRGFSFEPRSDARALDRDLYYRVVWEPAPLPTGAASRAPRRRWLLVADDFGAAEELASVLRARGEEVRLARDWRSLPLDSMGAGLAIVHLGGIGALGRDPLASDPVESPGLESLLSLVKTLAGSSMASPPRLSIVTRGVHEVGDASGVSPEAWPLWGLARVVSQEHPELGASRIDLGSADSLEIEALAAELLAETGDDEVALRGAMRFVARLERFSPEESAAAPEGRRKVPFTEKSAFRFELGESGKLELAEAARRKPGPGEIEIRVEAVGLSFLDVSREEDLGAECAGTVSALGPSGIDGGLRVGDRVVALSPSPSSRGLARSHAIVPEELAVALPDELDFASAAALPVAYVTAFYALDHLARLRQGERLLVTGGADALAQAAIGVARLDQAEVFAVADTEEERRLLESFGAGRVLDGSSAFFLEEAREAAGGRGFDVVLDTVGGGSLELLRPFGRYVNLSLTGSSPGTPGKNLISFHVDLPGLVESRPDLTSALLDRVLEEIGKGSLHPNRHEKVPPSAAGDALARLESASPSPKPVLILDEAPRFLLASREIVRPDATYLVTGGLGGLGLEVARWLVERGARHLALLGRRGSSAALEPSLRSLRARGAEVEVFRADVSRAEDLDRALAEIRVGRPPLRGIVHAAGILEDGILLGLDRESLVRVMAPKVQGAWNLSRSTWGDPLDFFVSFSSVASLLGTAGQGNYAAANAFLDGLAHYRRARGRVGLAIHWAPWADVGLAAEGGGGAHLERRGIGTIQPAQALAALERLLSCADAGGEVAVMPFSIEAWTSVHPHQSRSSFLAKVAGARSNDEHPVEGASFREELSRAPQGPARRALLEAHIREQVSRVTRIAPDQIDPEEPLKSQGLDSLMGLELRNRLERTLGLRLSATMVWNYPTVRLLTGFLDGPAESPSEAAASEELRNLLEGVSSLDSEEVGRMLSGRVRDSGKKAAS